MTELEKRNLYFEDRIDMLNHVIELCELFKENNLTFDNLIAELIDIQMEISENIYFDLVRLDNGK